jgi:hypothetical protein
MENPSLLFFLRAEHRFFDFDSKLASIAGCGGCRGIAGTGEFARRRSRNRELN